MKLSLIIASAGLAIALFPISGVTCQEVTSSWEGLEYIRLPPHLCSGISASLIGKLNKEQYSSVICQRQSHSYIFMQKLLGYTEGGESIWKIQNVIEVPKLNKNELIIQLGCDHLEIRNATVFAIVRQMKGNELLISQAWRANLIREKLERTNPRQVRCFPPSI